MEDAMIIGLYWDRNEEAVRQTRLKYERYLMKIAFNVLSDREDSEESVNDTYMKAWNSMPPHRPQVLSAFLGKITRELSIDLYRRRTAAKRGGSQYDVSLAELEETLSAGDQVQERAEGKLLADAISAFLMKLPRERRSMFVARYFYMDTAADIARMCGLPEGTVRSTLFRMRADLKKHLEKEGFVV